MRSYMMEHYSLFSICDEFPWFNDDMLSVTKRSEWHVLLTYSKAAYMSNIKEILTILYWSKEERFILNQSYSSLRGIWNDTNDIYDIYIIIM